MEISAHDNLDIPNTERDTQSNPHKHTLYKPQMLPCALKTPLTSSIDGLAYIFPLRNISHTLMFNCTTGSSLLNTTHSGKFLSLARVLEK